jgi:hypothetical protein
VLLVAVETADREEEEVERLLLRLDSGHLKDIGWGRASSFIDFDFLMAVN